MKPEEVTLALAKVLLVQEVEEVSLLVMEGAAARLHDAVRIHQHCPHSMEERLADEVSSLVPNSIQTLPLSVAEAAAPVRARCPRSSPWRIPRRTVL